MRPTADGQLEESTMTDPRPPVRSGPLGSGVDDQATVYDLAEFTPT